MVYSNSACAEKSNLGALFLVHPHPILLCKFCRWEYVGRIGKGKPTILPSEHWREVLGPRGKAGKRLWEWALHLSGGRPLAYARSDTHR